MPASLVPLAVALSVQGARAQEADLRWQVYETEHYRLSYPEPADAWAQHVASRLESIRADVAAEVGYEPSRRVDVVVLDPLRQSNGFAIPIGAHPRMGIFPTSPDAGSVLAWYRDWAEDLVVHEDTHLVHMLRRSRSPLWRSTVGLLGLDPITLGAPRWVFEGTATVVEGRLTGMGRPNSDLRAAWLRILAEDGRLPSYGMLSSTDGWMTGSHAYLVGSAYLEWLEARRCGGAPGERVPGDCGALRDLWARMSARKLRGFRTAFRGVFGDDPATLYNRFRAELDRDALTVQAARPVDDTLWQDLAQTTLSPEVSPDGSRILAVRRVDRENHLVIWSTADDPEIEEKWWAPHKKAVDKDPQDVLPVAPPVYPRDPEVQRDDLFRQAWEPRWMPDGKSVLFAAWEPDARGELRPDLFTWEPDTGRERRITRGAGVSKADPAPDGTWAVAHRQVWGEHSLVRVDLASGEITPLVEVPVPVALDHPRISPDGGRLLYLRHDGAWRLVLRDLSTGEERVLPTPDDRLVADPEWAPDGRHVFFALGTGGFIEIAGLDLDDPDATPVILTHSAGIATAPAPTPDGGALFHLSLDSDGIDLHRADIDWQRSPPPSVDGPPPILPPDHPAPPGPLATSDPGEPHRYGVGHLEWWPLLGGGAGVGHGQSEAGIRLGDVIGRQELLLLGGWGTTADVSGGSARWSWFGPPLGAGGHLRLTPFAVQADGRDWRGGAELSVGAERQAPRNAWAWEVGAWADASLEGGPAPAQAGFASLSIAPWAGSGAWIATELTAEGQALHQGAQTGGLGRGALGLGLGVRKLGLWARTDGGYSGMNGGMNGGGGWQLGGLDSSLLPVGWSMNRVTQPMLGPGALTGTWHSGGEAVLDINGLEFLARTDRAGTRFDPSGNPGLTWLGVRARSWSPAFSIAKIPSLLVDVGAGCIVEDPVTGWSDRWCRSLSDYGGWTSVTWGW